MNRSDDLSAQTPNTYTRIATLETLHGILYGGYYLGRVFTYVSVPDTGGRWEEIERR